MNKIWIGNGQLVLPDKIVPGGSVLLEGKKIAAVNVPCPPDARRVDVDGSYIMAGFVDAVITAAGISSFEKANIFFPRSFNEAPIWYTSVSSTIRKRS